MNAQTEIKSPGGFSARNGSETAAYEEGWKCGRSLEGMVDENPYKHRLSKKRTAWLQGWMDGGAIYLPGLAGSVPVERYRAALLLARELALELRMRCNEDIHHAQCATIEQLLAEIKSPND